MTPVVEAESLTKRFGEVSAVTDLSFALEAGTIRGFLGPNGAGKTTTLRMILGLVNIVHPIIGLCCWARNLVERFMTLCEDVAGGMGGT